MQDHESPRPPFAQTTLPWIVGGAALLVYLVTLNHWVTMASLSEVAKVTGWDWTPNVTGPVTFLVNALFRFLPVAIRPLAMNALMAVFAAGALALLVRSVTLLPHDRTREQRQRERSEYSLLSIPAAWLPPAFAALVCGLQLSYWEHATSATEEMLNLLLFAYCTRCLLEYRIDSEEKWLTRFALVYGIAITNNWAMLGFLPVFVTAMIWMMGKRFFQFRPFLRLVGFGLLGMLLYLLLPAIVAATKGTTLSFLDLLRYELGTQKTALLGFPRGRVLILSLTSLLPLLVMGVRWPSTFGDTSAAGAIMTSFMFQVVHGMFLAACLWVAFDPNFSPRSLGNGQVFLPFYYLGALAVGYFSGYFLLVSSTPPAKSRLRVSAGARMINRIVTAAVWIAFIAVPAGLVYKNYPLMRAVNSPVLKNFADQSLAEIPAAGAVILSDNSYHLALIQAGLDQRQHSGEFIFLDTQALPYPEYQRYLVRRFPKLFPEAWVNRVATAKEPLDSVSMLKVVNYLSEKYPVCYLHPSFGPFFENFYLQPRGLTYRMVAYKKTDIVPPPLSAEAIKLNGDFWAQAKGSLDSVVQMASQEVPGIQALSIWYSRAANYWGVELQKAGQLDQAGKFFESAQALNRENIPALFNFRYNQNLRTGSTNRVDLTKDEEELLRKYRRWEDLLMANGPFDEPGTCFKVGQVLARGGLDRQAALQFMRVRELDKDNLEAGFWLGHLYLTAPLPDKTLEILSDIKARQNVRPLTLKEMVETIRLEALAHFKKWEVARMEAINEGLSPAERLKAENARAETMKKEVSLAENILADAVKKYPQEDPLLDTMFYVYFGQGKYTDCLTVIARQLQIDPKNLRALLNQGATAIKTRDYALAIDSLNKVLKVEPENRNALRNRGIAFLESGRLDDAQKDYEALQKMMPDSYVVSYGMADIAYRRKDMKTALENYELFLKTAPAGTEEYGIAQKRAEEIKSGAGAR